LHVQRFGQFVECFTEHVHRVAQLLVVDVQVLIEGLGYRIAEGRNRTGEFLGSTPKLIGRAYFNQYTVLILATWLRTDVTAYPVAGQW